MPWCCSAIVIASIPEDHQLDDVDPWDVASEVWRTAEEESKREREDAWGPASDYPRAFFVNLSESTQQKAIRGLEMDPERFTLIHTFPSRHGGGYNIRLYGVNYVYQATEQKHR